MTRDTLKTLFHAFDTGELPVPRSGARVLFLGAEPGFDLPEGFEAAPSLVQGFRPSFCALQSSGCQVTPRPQGNDFDAVLLLCGRHRGENENRVVEALDRTKPGGLIVIAGGKEDGIASLRKRIAGLLVIEGQAPKYHGLAFWFRRPHNIPEAAAALRSGHTVVEGHFRTAPGMFSHDRIDPGSKLLADNLPPLSGAVADFCAGWGYLAWVAMTKSSGMTRLDLYEADYEALEAARLNLAPLQTSKEIRFFWHDLVAEPVTERYNAIVMNPPFHRSRAAEPALGKAMIAAAASALGHGGRLLMVANRHLPYEAALDAAFGTHEEICRDAGFKVLSARR